MHKKLLAALMVGYAIMLVLLVGTQSEHQESEDIAAVPNVNLGDSSTNNKLTPHFESEDNLHKLSFLYIEEGLNKIIIHRKDGRVVVVPMSEVFDMLKELCQRR